MDCIATGCAQPAFAGLPGRTDTSPLPTWLRSRGFAIPETSASHPKGGPQMSQGMYFDAK